MSWLLVCETPTAALSSSGFANQGSCLADRRMCCGSSINYFERLSRIIVLDNLRIRLCVNSDGLLFDVSFEPHCVEFLIRNELGFNQQVFFIIINVKIQRTSPL